MGPSEEASRQKCDQLLSVLMRREVFTGGGEATGVEQSRRVLGSAGITGRYSPLKCINSSNY